MLRSLRISACAIAFGSTTYVEAKPHAPFTSTRKIIRGGLIPDDAFVIFYSGGYNTWTDVETLFAALDQLMADYPQMYFVSTGGKIEGHDDLTYSRFINGLDLAGVEVDRKVLADLAVHEPDAFNAIAAQAKAALA